MQNSPQNPALGATDDAPTGPTTERADLREAALALGLKAVKAYVLDEAKKNRVALAQKEQSAHVKKRKHGEFNK